MTYPVFFRAFVDFRSPLELLDVADLLSRHLFAGVRFCGLNEGLWDEVPAVRLENDFLNLRIELGGGDGEYTLEIQSFKYDFGKVPKDQHQNVMMDISHTIKVLAGSIPDIQIVDGHY